jgi:hypothetical protein
MPRECKNNKDLARPQTLHKSIAEIRQCLLGVAAVEKVATINKAWEDARLTAPDCCQL